jgi:hypothetical protein
LGNLYDVQSRSVLLIFSKQGTHIFNIYICCICSNNDSHEYLAPAVCQAVFQVLKMPYVCVCVCVCVYICVCRQTRRETKRTKVWIYKEKLSEIKILWSPAICIDINFLKLHNFHSTLCHFHISGIYLTYNLVLAMVMSCKILNLTWNVFSSLADCLYSNINHGNNTEIWISLFFIMSIVLSTSTNRHTKIWFV